MLDQPPTPQPELPAIEPAPLPPFPAPVAPAPLPVAASIETAQSSSPVAVVDFEEAVKPKRAKRASEPQDVNFWFGEIGVLEFPKGRTLHVKAHSMTISDPEIIAHLDKLAEDRQNKIFRQ